MPFPKSGPSCEASGSNGHTVSTLLDVANICRGGLGLFGQVLRAVVAHGRFMNIGDVALQAQLLVIQAIALLKFALGPAAALVYEVNLFAHVVRCLLIA